MITQRNKPRLVLMSVGEFRRLMERGQSRKATTLGAMSDELFAEVEKAVDAYEAERETP